MCTYKKQATPWPVLAPEETEPSSARRFVAAHQRTSFPGGTSPHPRYSSRESSQWPFQKSP